MTFSFIDLLFLICKSLKIRNFYKFRLMKILIKENLLTAMFSLSGKILCFSKSLAIWKIEYEKDIVVKIKIDFNW